MDWESPYVDKLRLLHAPEHELRRLTPGRQLLYDTATTERATMITIHSPHPGLMSDVDPKRSALFAAAMREELARHREAVRCYDVRWAIVGWPSENWATAVFPNLPPGEAQARLWACILQASRVNNDPVVEWECHLSRLKKRIEWLNEFRLRRLYFRGPGTDLTVELPDGHIWLGGDVADPNGIRFVPNIPTEEVFTVPHRTGVDGTVRATRPLHYNDQVIEGMELVLRGGEVIEARAQRGQEALDYLLAVDEGARRLGEVALVPEDSPITQMCVVFHNTLFDENASCHLALGSAYPNCLPRVMNLSPDERTAHGVNRSQVHVDFMVGSHELHRVC